MLWIPVIIFSLNGAYLHSFTVDRVFNSSQECHSVIDPEVKALLESGKAPEDGTVTGGCIVLPPSVKTAPKAPEKPVEPCDECKEL